MRGSRDRGPRPDLVRRGPFRSPLSGDHGGGRFLLSRAAAARTGDRALFGRTVARWLVPFLSAKPLYGEMLTQAAPRLRGRPLCPDAPHTGGYARRAA